MGWFSVMPLAFSDNGVRSVAIANHVCEKKYFKEIIMTGNENSEDKVKNMKARILLSLCVSGETTKAELRRRLLGKQKDYADFENVLNEELKDLVTLTTKSRSTKVKLNGDEWQKTLTESLPSLKFTGTVVGTWVVEGLLEYIKLAPTVASVAVMAVMSAPKISSYDEFKAVALEAYEKLKQINALYGSGFIPIWHMRQQFSESVTSENFNVWLIQMQTDNIFHLRTGGSEATNEQKSLSIHDEIRGLLFTLTKVV